mmetsp:Transcript_3182/g.10519  ORF Transcript_3182/g.10519 Transcript_3182/m.10519 type:complete len:321 (+) Transcript_3182:50-1012(+)
MATVLRRFPMAVALLPMSASATMLLPTAACMSTSAIRVLVTGAGGRTGALAFEKIAARPEQFAPPTGLVNSRKAMKRLRKAGASPEQIFRGDVTNKESMLSAFKKASPDAVIICTSAVPQINKLSILKLLLAKLFRREGVRPTFRFPPGASPEEVDYYGLKNQIDAAKDVGAQRVVLVSSMGGTDPNNFLNTIGVKPDGTGGQILMWKRKGEKYLVESGLDYTIIHPGGLLDKPGGERKLVIGVDDELLKDKSRSIPRADVAAVCVQALLTDGASKRSIDLKSEEEGPPTTDFDSLFASTDRNCDYKIDPGEPKAAIKAS